MITRLYTITGNTGVLVIRWTKSNYYILSITAHSCMFLADTIIITPIPTNENKTVEHLIFM